MGKKVQIGLLSPFFVPISGYEEAANHLNLDLVIVTPQRIDWKKHVVSGLVFTGQAWVEETVSLPRSVYNRYYGPRPKVVNRLETVIGKDKVFNHVTHFDKLQIHQLLAKSSLNMYLPATDPYSPKRLVQYIDRFQQVILKPVKGQLGNKIYLIDKHKGIIHLHYGTKSPIAHFYSSKDLLAKLESMISQGFLVQQYIPLASVDGRVFDLRFLVQKDRMGLWGVSAMLSRLALRYSYITNLSWAILPVEDTLKQAFSELDLDFLPMLKGLAIKAAQTVEASLGSLGELSVDLGLDSKGGIWIIELNAKPMKNTFLGLGNSKIMEEIYRQPLRYALHLAGY